jgi:hypothetical protein
VKTRYDHHVLGDQTMKKEKKDDRREQDRFKVKPGAVVLLAQNWPHSTIVGNILDISKEGVGIQIVDDQAVPQNAFEVGLACTKPHYFFARLRAEAVSEVTMTKIPFGSLVPRRLGLRFAPLTDDQSSDIEAYIRNNAVEKV